MTKSIEIGHMYKGRDGREAGEEEGTNKDGIYSRACSQSLGPTR